MLLKVVLGVAIVPVVAGLVALAVAAVLPLLPLLLLGVVVWGVFAMLARRGRVTTGSYSPLVVPGRYIAPPWRRALQRPAESKERRLVERPADQLESRRETGRRRAGR